MKKVWITTLFLLALSSMAHAQTLVQSAVHTPGPAPVMVHSATLPKPVTSGDFLLVFMRNCNYATVPGQPFTDSQGNLWHDEDIYHDKWYVEAAKGGPLTLTFSYVSPNYCQFGIVEFSGSWTFDVTAHPLYTDDTMNGASNPITPSQSGELIIGFSVDDCHCALGYDPAISAGAGFQVAALTAPLLIEYMVQPVAATVTATDHHAAPVDTILTVAAFKPKPNGCLVQ
jgi:hypothetical protein